MNTPWATAAASAAAALLFVLAHLVHLGGDASLFAQVGRLFADPAHVPDGITVIPHYHGYDGQFYFRLALDPFSTERTVDGISFDDGAYRQQRILYPILVWAVTGGSPRLVVAALIMVNIVGVAVIGWLAGYLARTSGRHALWGLAISLYPGYVVTLARDLTEIVSSCFLLGTLALLRGQRPITASIANAVGVLARETLLVVPAAVLACLALDGLRRRPVRLGQLALLLPFAAITVWQALLLARWGATPAHSSAAAFSGPFVGVTLAIVWRATHLTWTWLWLPFFVYIVFAFVLAAAALRDARVPVHEKIAWLGYLAAAVSLDVGIWTLPDGFLRSLNELASLSALVLLAARDARAIRAYTAFTLVAWLFLASFEAVT
ncbi:MAG: hypothetical protein KGJ98_08765 [Chloroflexota bacterium]|nr:hypothetical protein [Chloroflexota bacterium]